MTTACLNAVISSNAGLKGAVNLIVCYSMTKTNIIRFHFLPYSTVLEFYMLKKMCSIPKITTFLLYIYIYILEEFLFFESHTHTHTQYIYIYIYIYVCVCVCVCVCAVT